MNPVALTPTDGASRKSGWTDNARGRDRSGTFDPSRRDDRVAGDMLFADGGGSICLAPCADSGGHIYVILQINLFVFHRPP
jgi:hypothetical protein